MSQLSGQLTLDRDCKKEKNEFSFFPNENFLVFVVVVLVSVPRTISPLSPYTAVRVSVLLSYNKQKTEYFFTRSTRMKKSLRQAVEKKLHRNNYYYYYRWFFSLFYIMGGFVMIELGLCERKKIRSIKLWFKEKPWFVIYELKKNVGLGFKNFPTWIILALSLIFCCSER